MVNYSIANFTNGSGPQDILIYEASQVPQLMGALIFFVYVVILGVGMAYQKDQTGNNNIFMWSTISGLITTTAAFILFLYDNLLSIEVVMVCLFVTIASAIVFLSSDRN